MHIDKPMLIPEIEYLTNDSWELVSAIAGQSGWPMLHSADYETGHLYILTIPDNFSDLYRLPPEVLTRIPPDRDPGSLRAPGRPVRCRTHHLRQ